jgi:HSP20 family protein
MSYAVKCEPYADMGGFNKTVNDLNKVFGVNFSRIFEDAGITKGNWAPAVDVREDENGIALEADLPGLKKDDFELSIENYILTLKGERKFEKKDEASNYHRVERGYGKFVRTFTLPSTVDVDKVKADFKDGVFECFVASQRGNEAAFDQDRSCRSEVKKLPSCFRRGD